MNMKHNESAKFISMNIGIDEIEDNSVSIKCGHGMAGEFLIPLRQSDPRIFYLCCRGCYHMISGDMIERAFTVKMS